MGRSLQRTSSCDVSSRKVSETSGSLEGVILTAGIARRAEEPVVLGRVQLAG